MISEKLTHKYCKDDISKIENYAKAIADTTQIWNCHHRLELTLDGEYAHSREELKRLGMYFHRPYFELIFMTKSEHRRLHMSTENSGENNPFYGKHHSPDTKKKLSELNHGENHPRYGTHHLEETLRKMSAAHKGENNPMYGKHHSEETRRRMSESHKRR